jgi:hypothetical protein
MAHGYIIKKIADTSWCQFLSYHNERAIDSWPVRHLAAKTGEKATVLAVAISEL